MTDVGEQRVRGNFQRSFFTFVQPFLLGHTLWVSWTRGDMGGPISSFMRGV